MKRYIWGFPGIGKSSVSLPGVRVVDTDCELFKFKGVADIELHSDDREAYFEPDENYPRNYIEYVQSVGADMVLLNCHLSLLESLGGQDDILIVYPDESLLSEFVDRYRGRGDHSSFVSYVEEEWEGMIGAIEESEFDKYKIDTENTYLSDLFARSGFKMKLMTRVELTEQLQRAIDLNVIVIAYQAGDNPRLEFKGIYMNKDDGELSASVNYTVKRPQDAAKLAEAVLNGEYALDIDDLMSVCEMVEMLLHEEKEKRERRGGLSREELADKIMQGIVNGAISVRHGQIAPYSYGYAVTFNGGGAGEAGRNRWECYCDFFEIPNVIVDKIERDTQDRATFSKVSVPPLNIEAMLYYIDQAEQTKITSFTPEKDTDFERWGSRGYNSRGSIASLADVHKGKGLDGIAKGHYGGDYSSMTTSRQNDMIQSLVFMKGFCLDCLSHLHSAPAKENIINYLKKHGTDISTPDRLQDWILDNPGKCGYEDNRVYEAQRLAAEKQVLDLIENAIKASVLAEGPNGGVMVIKSFEDGSERWQEVSKTEAAYDLAYNDKVSLLEDAIKNRSGANSAHKLYAQAYCDFVKLKSVVDNFKGSFEELCYKLGGDRYEDNVFRLDYGVLAVDVSVLTDGTLNVDESAMAIWDPNKEDFLENCVSFKYIKETCEEIGFNLKTLRAEALLRSTDGTPSLDARIGSAEAKKIDDPVGLGGKQDLNRDF